MSMKMKFILAITKDEDYVNNEMMICYLEKKKVVFHECKERCLLAKTSGIH